LRKATPIAGENTSDVESEGTNMTKFRRVWMCVVTMLTIACLTAGCNTIKGAGKDIEAGGEALQRAAD